MDILREQKSEEREKREKKDIVKVREIKIFSENLSTRASKGRERRSGGGRTREKRGIKYRGGETTYANSYQ